MGVDLDTYRRDSLETWGLMASGWEARREWMTDITGRVNEWLADRLRAEYAKLTGAS